MEGKCNCKKCDGNGKIKCTKCKGDGHIFLKDEEKEKVRDKQGYFKTIDCDRCYGDQFITCTVCTGNKKTTCQKCKGNWNTPCRICDHGTVECRTCHGATTVTCKKCAGTGSIFFYPVLHVTTKKITDDRLILNQSQFGGNTLVDAKKMKEYLNGKPGAAVFEVQDIVKHTSNNASLSPIPDCLGSEYDSLHTISAYFLDNRNTTNSSETRTYYYGLKLEAFQTSEIEYDVGFDESYRLAVYGRGSGVGLENRLEFIDRWPGRPRSGLGRMFKGMVCRKQETPDISDLKLGKTDSIRSFTFVECAAEDVEGVVRGKVIYDYAADTVDELDIRIGDILENVVIGDDGWSTVEFDGKHGMVPTNFFRILL